MFRSRLRVVALVAAVVVAACSGADSVSGVTTSTAPGDEQGEEIVEETSRAVIGGLPTTVVARRLDGLLSASLDGSLSEAQVEESLTDAFRQQISPAEFVAVSAQLPGLIGRAPVVSDLRISAEYAIAGSLLNSSDGSMWEFLATSEVEQPHRLSTYTIVPAPSPSADPTITDLEAARTAWARLAAAADLSITEIDPSLGAGACIDDGPVMAIASTFKFYVLGAVATAVESGAIDWSDELVIDDRYRSLPSGQLQQEAVGAALSVAEAAELMMAMSDNTATDHLVAIVGREQVEAELITLGHSEPARNRPLPTTRELFQLKLGDPIRLGLYGEGSEAERRQLLADLVGEPLPDPSTVDLVEPKALDVEWFASTADLCRAVVGLDRRGDDQPSIRRALQANRGVTLDRRQWPVVSFKGGSEPGVLSLTWLVERVDGRRYVVSAIANDPDAPIDEGAAFAIVGAVFEVLAGSS